MNSLSSPRSRQREQGDDNFSHAINGDDPEGDVILINLDMAFARVGGFGLFQSLAVFSLALLRNSGNWLVYIYVYLNLP